MYKLIIVDDDDGVRDSLAYHFEDYNYDVTVASSSEEAKPLIENGSFDIAIVDLRLPKQRGDDFIKEIYSSTNKIKFIIYTGSEEFSLDSDLKSMDRVCDRVIYKPIEDLMDLNLIIDELMEA